MINHYGNAESISKAITDIKQYDEALGLREKVTEAMKTAYAYDLPKTPAGMIKTFRSYFQRAEELIKYGEKVVTRAETEVKALIDDAEATIKAKQKELTIAKDELENLQDQNAWFEKDTQINDLEKLIKNYKQDSSEYSEYKLTLKNIKDKYVNQNKQELDKYNSLASKSDANIYKVVNAELLQQLKDFLRKDLAVLAKISDNCNCFEDIKNVIPKIHEKYSQIKSGEIELFETFNKPDLIDWDKLKLETEQSSRLNLAPELQASNDLSAETDYDCDRLFFKESIDNQFANHHGYTQKAIPEFDLCNIHFFSDKIKDVHLLGVTLDVPAKKVSDRGGHNRKDDLTNLFSTHGPDSIFEIGPKTKKCVKIDSKAMYVLDNKKITSLWIRNEDSITCRLTTDDPLYGHVMTLLDDRIIKYKRYDHAKAIKEGKLAILNIKELE